MPRKSKRRERPVRRNRLKGHRAALAVDDSLEEEERERGRSKEVKSESEQEEDEAELEEDD
jgi:hypothetical protein